jgi:hypothetical protein
MTSRKTTRAENPFGISVVSVVKWGAIGLGGIWILSKFTPGNAAQNIINQIVGPPSNNSPSGVGSNDPLLYMLLGQSPIYTDPNARAQIAHIDYTPINRCGPADINWVVNHKGPAEHFTVGLDLYHGLGTADLLQRTTADMWCGNDADWASYSVGLTTIVTCDVRVYLGAFYVAWIRADNSTTMLYARRV